MVTLAAPLQLVGAGTSKAVGTAPSPTAESARKRTDVGIAEQKGNLG